MAFFETRKTVIFLRSRMRVVISSIIKCMTGIICNGDVCAVAHVRSNFNVEPVLYSYDRYFS